MRNEFSWVSFVVCVFAVSSRALWAPYPVVWVLTSIEDTEVMSSLLFSGIWRFKQPEGHFTSFDNIEITHGVSLKGDFGQISE